MPKRKVIAKAKESTITEVTQVLSTRTCQLNQATQESVENQQRAEKPSTSKKRGPMASEAPDQKPILKVKC